MQSYIILIILMFFAPLCYGQQINGKVTEAGSSGKSLPGANVYWTGTTAGTVTGSEGEFMLELPDSLPAELIISFIGYQQDTILISETPAQELLIALKSSVELDEVEITGRTRSTEISTIDPIYTETISNKELGKAACCNLSESFEINASVDVNYTDAVSGAKKIQMLGLDGIYTQIMFENIPYIRGLASSYGLAHTPGTWVDAIQVTKGTGSVVNGYESITGQINLEMLKPDETDRLYLNLYGNQAGRAEANLHAAHRFNDKWSTMVFAHANDMSVRQDVNGDSFLNMPLKKNYTFMNRWKYFGKRYGMQFGVRGLDESIQGGQKSFNYNRDLGSTNAFGLGVDTRQAELFAKNGILFPDKPYKSIGIMSSAKYHEQNSYFGLKTYEGEQKSFYANLIYQTIVSNTAHTVKTGASYQFDEFQEVFNDSSFSRTESVPGVFAEYTYNNDNNFSAVTGLRADYHNLFGPMLNPRVHLKYNFSPVTAVRLSGGRGFRTANIFAEHASVFASSRRVMVMETPLPEIAWNSGVSFTHKFSIKDGASYFNVDFFRTEFTNQMVMDMENDRYVKFYNLKGRSFSNSFQVEFGTEPVRGLEIKTAYKWYDVKTTYDFTKPGGDIADNRLLQRPLVPQHRGLLNAGYTTISENWKFDATLQWFGTSRLPSTAGKLPEHQIDERSDAYYVVNGQVTRVINKWDIYLGTENLFNFIQPNPIIAPEAPFSDDFDASIIWGPVMGRIVYLGVKFRL